MLCRQYIRILIGCIANLLLNIANTVLSINLYNEFYSLIIGLVLLMQSLLLQIENSLKSTIQLILDLSSKNGYVGDFPKYKYEIKYYEPSKGNTGSSTLKTEERESPSFSTIYKEIRNEVENSRQYKDLNSKCNLFKSEHSKYMDKYWSCEYGDLFIREYFSKLSKLVLNKELIKKFNIDI